MKQFLLAQIKPTQRRKKEVELVSVNRLKYVKKMGFALNLIEYPTGYPTKNTYGLIPLSAINDSGDLIDTGVFLLEFEGKCEKSPNIVYRQRSSGGARS